MALEYMYNAPAVGDRMNIQSQAPEPVPANKEEDKEVVPLVEQKQINSHQFYPPSYYNATEPAQTSRRVDKSRILGFRPTTFWLSLLLAILLVAGAIDGGVGGSFVSKDSSKPSSTLAPITVSIVSSMVLQSVGATISPPITPPVPSSTDSLLPSVTSQTPGISISPSLAAPGPSVISTVLGNVSVLGYTDCPASNFTLYTSLGLKFTLVCGQEWSSSANDLTEGGVNATTLEKCMDICANYTVEGDGSCKGAVYDPYPQWPGGPALCYPKSAGPSPSLPWSTNDILAGGFLT